MKRKATKQEVLDTLKIRSFDELPDEKVTVLAEYLPHMSLDDANDALNNVPRYVQAVVSIFGYYKEAVLKIKGDRSTAILNNIENYQAIIDKNLPQLDREDLSLEQRESINTVLLKAADQKKELTTMGIKADQISEKKFWDLCVVGFTVIGGAIGIPLAFKLYNSSKR